MPEPENVLIWSLQQDYQQEIVELMDELEPHYEGHSRMVILLASVRLMAAMLAPAKPETRAEIIARLPDMVRAVVARILHQVPDVEPKS